MIIAIDGYEANIDKRVGIGRYAYELILHLYRRASEDIAKKKKLEFRIYVPGKPRVDMPKETYWWQYRSIPVKRFWTLASLPIALALDMPHADVVFSPTHYIPRFTNIPKVMAIMDLSYLTYPQLFRRKDLHQLVHWTRYSVQHVHRILTISAFCQHAIMETYNVPKDRVTVTYPGFSMETSASTQSLHTKYKFSKDYILSVGTLQPRKNYIRLIEAFAKYVKQVKHTSLQLVIVGKKGWLYDQILNAPKVHGVEDRVKFLSFVPDSDLPSLYTNAKCFCLPSLYEGFGLPVLEAMAHECPVVVSNISSLPEIAGKAGIYVDPEDVDSIVKGIDTALTERGTKAMEERIAIGKTQVKKFTWEEAAKNTLEVLEEVGGKK